MNTVDVTVHASCLQAGTLAEDGQVLKNDKSSYIEFCLFICMK